MRRPSIYRYDGRWWHGGGCGWGTPKPWRTLFWYLRNGYWQFGRHWPVLMFGIGCMWYDGPHYYAHLGVFWVTLDDEP